MTVDPARRLPNDPLMPLLECYESLDEDGLLPLHNHNVEPLRAVSKVEEFRRYFKPTQPQVILLAESHRFNNESELGRVVAEELLPRRLLSQSYPCEFVQFVYCLGCGENCLLDEPLPNLANRGTPQFWKLFYASIKFPNGHSEFFWPILKSRTSLENRIATKTELLFTMKQQGIWLVDASIVAVDGLRKTNARQYASILERCWNMHVGLLIREIGPSKLIVIGKGVHDVLGKSLEAEFQGRLTVIHQPQSRNRTPAERLEDLRHVHSVCHSSGG